MAERACWQAVVDSVEIEELCVRRATHDEQVAVTDSIVNVEHCILVVWIFHRLVVDDSI